MPKYAQMKKSIGFRSDDLGGHTIAPLGPTLLGHVENLEVIFINKLE